MKLDPRAALVLSALAALALTACAAAPPPVGNEPPPRAAPLPAASSAPADPSAPAPRGLESQAPGRQLSPVDSDMMAIGRAESEIDRLLADAGGGRKKPKEAEAGKAPMADKASPLSGDGCSVACKALASMRSSAEHLCSLAGEGDGRCDDARARVRGATSRVRSACPGCSP
jgi:hypothetical protein